MLYVFHVDTGTMMTFDMNLALESVGQLKEVIARMCRIPADKQVLLVSGGESLEGNVRVCQYSAAGTDTNPIFLFSKTTIESQTPPSPSINYGSDYDMNEEVKIALKMLASYETVVKRTKLAQRFFDLAVDQTKVCEQLVHDQHLQQQGWAAVVANLEDITTAFRTKADLFEQSFHQYLGSRETYFLLIQNFKTDLDVLRKIPVIPALILSDDDSEDAKTTEISLLQWISSKDNQSDLEKVAEQCFCRLEQFDQTALDTLKADTEAAIQAATNVDMKEIRGLEERLSGLENLMFSNKKYVQEQEELSIAFSQNQQRVNKLGDASILPDLCNSHGRQLSVMLKNHQNLRDIRRRCFRAKEELSVNLYQRLKWVVYVQNNMSEVSHKLLIYHEGLRALKKRLDIIHQIHLAPEIYMSAVGEVVRRKSFSKAFLKWAHDLSGQLQEIHKEEVARRQAFQRQFENHFLRSLFPGLDDEPPPFATQAPKVFDNSLPELTSDDVGLLKQALPELASAIPEYSESSFNFLFSAHLVRSNITEQNALTPSQDAADSSIGGLLQPTSSIGHDLSPQPSIDVPSLPKEDRGFESETDTEEFEKVGQSPIDLNLPLEAPPCLILTSDKSSSQQSSTPSLQQEKEENLGNVSSEELHMRNALKSMANLALTEAQELKGQLNSLKVLLNVHSKDMTESLEDFKRESLDKLTRQQHQHEETITNVKKLLHDREQNLATAKEELARAETKEGILRAELQAKHTQALEALGSKLRCEAELELQRQVTELQAEAQVRLEQTMVNAEEEKKAAIKEMTDRLHRDHRMELEGLRSRFRMVHASQMERSPSDTSLEKIERGDLIEIGQHETALAKLRQEMTEEQEAAVAEGAARERKRLESELDRERNRQMKQEAAKQVAFNEALRRVAADKDRQMDAMRQECERMKLSVEKLTEDQAKAERELQEQRETIRRLQLHQHRRSSRALRHVNPDHDTMSTSVAVVTEAGLHSRDIGHTTSPESSRRRLQEDSRFRDRLSRSTNAMIQQGLLNFGSCNTGDIVLVLWDEEMNNFVILQDSSTLYFLHSDCVEALGLSTSASTDEAPRKMYCLAQVVKKEYCFARKAENRFGVPKDTKFYRVMVQVAQRGESSVHHQRGTSPRHQAGASSMSTSQQFSRSELETSRFGPGNSSTL